ncbi:flagellar export protein FliJ [Niameybacter massiliensis]|uniref:Flagellar FliJ protein n=1 Tax=Holtiella tumoricola TaxID=3018743 RepID=A0AA42J1Z0_9FIRM|nr:MULTISPECIES: flagellar export protein FliJ [Lachnospirales]MDA3732588.1 flagellar export protein FliJ [Holtiella tumoricola]
MSKFKFTLEPILSLRQNTEDLCKRELGICLNEKAKLDEQYEKLIAVRNEILEAMRPENNQVLDIERLKYYKSYDETIKMQQMQLAKMLRQLEETIDEKKEALKEAVKEKKILENLKELHYADFIEVCKKEEQQLVDELVAYKYSQKDEGE